MIGTIKTMAENKFQPNKSEEMDYVEEPWTLIGSYFKNKHLQQLVRHQLESYNEFITTQLPKTIDMFNPIHIVSEQDYMEKYDKYRLEIDINLKFEILFNLLKLLCKIGSPESILKAFS